MATLSPRHPRPVALAPYDPQHGPSPPPRSRRGAEWQELGACASRGGEEGGGGRDGRARENDAPAGSALTALQHRSEGARRVLVTPCERRTGQACRGHSRARNRCGPPPSSRRPSCLPCRPPCRPSCPSAACRPPCPAVRAHSSWSPSPSRPCATAAAPSATPPRAGAAANGTAAGRAAPTAAARTKTRPCRPGLPAPAAPACRAALGRACLARALRRGRWPSASTLRAGTPSPTAPPRCLRRRAARTSRGARRAAP
mmetsp:Transcript_43366/g.143442  ORF Transcript_43366/g.143442 Transcript_43366/m.143442 type:complete len:257 (-) Transcript_43366:231-1001(-)